MEATQTSPDQVPHALPAREFSQTSFTSFLSPSAIPNLSSVGFWIYWRCREHNVNFVCVWTDSCWWRHFVGRRCLWRLDVGKSRVIRDSQWGWKRKKDWLIDLILCIYTVQFPLSVQTGSYMSDIILLNLWWSDKARSRIQQTVGQYTQFKWFLMDVFFFTYHPNSVHTATGAN